MPLQKPIICAPWGGWKDDLPPNVAQMNSFSQITNWLINKGRIFSFPNRTVFPSLLVQQQGGGAFPILGLRSFQDGLGNFHTVGLSAVNAQYYTPPPAAQSWFSVLWQDLAGIVHTQWSPTSIAPYASEIVFNKLFFANGGAPLSYVIGDIGSYIAGDVPGTCYFLGKLAGHLMMVNTIEPVADQPGSTAYTARVRWSMSNNPLVWVTNPSTGLQEFTAGALDLTDVEDQLTGWATLGTYGYAYRNNGITVFIPTGNAANPFQVENYSIGPAGIGNNYPYCLGVYGTISVFPAINDIYTFDGASFPQPIGGNAKRSIYKDLQSASSQCFGFMIGSLFPGVDYLSYWLLCPQNNNTSTSVWVYHFDDQTWVNDSIQFGGAVTANTVVIA